MAWPRFNALLLCLLALVIAIDGADARTRRTHRPHVRHMARQPPTSPPRMGTTEVDGRLMLYMPRHFDPNRPATVVVFFHGKGSTLVRDVMLRQQVPRQIAESGLNAVLVAPQFGFGAVDTGPGPLGHTGAFRALLDQVARRFTTMTGRPEVGTAVANASVVLVAYSRGYLPAAYTLAIGGAGERVKGIILMDALYGHTGVYAAWLSRHQHAGFFLSAYTPSTQPQNTVLQGYLAAHRIAFSRGLGSSLAEGSIVFVPVMDGNHTDFVSKAFARDPLKVLLARTSPTPSLFGPAEFHRASADH